MTDRSKLKPARDLRMEKLEDRTVLDGNVTVFVQDGSLFVSGDTLDNQVLIYPVSRETIAVLSIDGATSINGRFEPLLFSNVRKDAVVNLGAGNDNLQLHGLKLRGNLTIDAGAGDDTVVTSLNNVRKSFFLLGNDGNDSINLRNELVINALNLDAGAGNDTVNVGNSRTGKNTTFNGGAGTDAFGAAGFVTGRNYSTINFETNASTLVPTARNDAATVDENGSVRVEVATNDNAAQGNLQLGKITIVQAPANGTAIPGTDGSITYNHNGSNTTSDTFTYTILDSQSIPTNVATVTITITEINDAPVGMVDEATVDEGGTVNINVVANDTDEEMQLLRSSVAIVAAPNNGTATANPDGTVTYVHNGGESTTDTFTYTVMDAGGNVSTETAVNITITPVNDAPVANADQSTVARGGTVVVGLAQNDVDPEGQLDVSSIEILTAAANGTVTLLGDGRATYFHNNSATTTDTFTYRIKDREGLASNTATVTIAITGVVAP